jgi:plasmid stabilization system protein ParE
MNFRFTPRAESEAEKKQAWWRENRRAEPDLFDDELAATLKRITEIPTLGTTYPSAFDTIVRRVLMARTKNHVYYAVHEGEVVVLAVWGAPRARGPKL